jgi:non-heme chloroperoxidase
MTVAVTYLQAPWQPRLEVLSLPASGRTARPPILMVHGAYTHGGSWRHTFMPWFAGRGHDVHAVSLRGHGGSDGHPMLDAWGLDHYGEDVRRALAMIGQPAIVFGSSMGGLVLQRLLSEGPAIRAMVLVSSVPPTGLFDSVSRMTFDRPRQMGQLLQLAIAGRSGRGMLELLAHDPLPMTDETAASHMLTRESSRALWEMTWAPMPWSARTAAVVPMLAVHGEYDRMIPASAVQAIARQFQAMPLLVPEVGHVPMIERRWESVAQSIADWLERQR